MRTALLLGLLTGCLATPSDDPVVVFDAVWEDFDALYGGFGFRGVDWDDTYDRWRPEVAPRSSDDELFAALTGMVAELDDAHVMLAAPDRELFESNRIFRERVDDERFDPDVVREHYLTDVEVGPDEAWTRGRLADGSAYVWFPWIDDNQFTIGAILEEEPALDHLVIDLRHNGGGDFMYAFEAYEVLTDRRRPVFRSRTRDAPERGSFGPWTTWSLHAGDDPWTGRITVLTDRWTVSAGERATLALRSLPRVTLVGEPTNGALATMIGREAPNGWGYSLSTQEVTDPDGTTWEAVGIPVDIPVLNDPEVLAGGIDEVLERVLESSAGG